MSVASSASSTATTLEVFATAQELIVSLLHFWPHAPSVASPSLLLCGPSGNGKSFLISQAAQDARQRLAPAHSTTSPTTSNTTPPHGTGSAQDSRATRVVMVAPSLAPALTVRRVDGSTGLRRLLRAAIREGITPSRVPEEGKTNPNGTAEISLLVVLDRLELFLSIDGEGADAVGPAGSGAHGDGDRHGEDDDGAGRMPAARHPAFLTDVFTTLTSAPPLLTREEAAHLGVRRLVFVSVFSGDVDEVHPFLREFAFTHAVSLPTPSQTVRESFFANALGHGGAASVYMGHLAKALAMRTGGVSFRGLTEVVQLALSRLQDDPTRATEAGRRVGMQGTNGGDAHLSRDAEGEVPDEDAVTAVTAAAAHKLVSQFQSSASMAALDYRSNAGYVDVQHTRWSDIAGMAHVKKALQDALTRPLRHMALYKATGVQPSKGILLYGPPGTGKTMLAKAVATELNASFVYVDLPSLVQCEVGESERKLQNFFAVARERSPTVMFVDELQAAFGIRYGGGPAAAASAHDARLVSHLLQLLDAAQADETHVIVFIGATNVVEMLDPLLLRAGRLDTHIAVGLPGPDARESLARGVVYGDWAAWWPAPQRHPVDADGGGSAADEGGSSALLPMREALVDAFVSASDGFSGAELRHATSVFALKLLQRASAEGVTATPSAEALGDETPAAEARMMREWSQVLHDLLWSESRNALTATAVELVRIAFSRGQAGRCADEGCE